ncbi:MAG: phosphate acyltransferase PlsX [Butyrivibrio sp.]|uniref:phosphate acyltransferase PlsX n=1 Tax=Butyrivibrio sp. TaxID=28121 RepID=UPI0025EC702C|nr:phosphate acyltransferase PlsX [Butyrivibrio sp.]MCR5772803.1 phosphate acyltransferase PlsX [Butyrivibrio sp.]
MADLIRVAVDAMGGDNAPGEIVKGAIEAIKEDSNVKVFLVGQEDKIQAELSKYNGYDQNRVEIVNATQIIEMAEAPVVAIRQKPDSSIVKAMQMVKHGEADAYVSAGSTGANLVGGQTIVGRIKGVKRAPLAPMIPTEKGVSLLIDCGANVDARPDQLLQFAIMGSIYAENILGKRNPTVGLLSIGTEEDKGNSLVKETFPLLKNCPDINFIGNVESREIPAGAADVIVTEAFAGNIALKMYEGVAKTMGRVIKNTFLTNLRTKIAYLLLKKEFTTNLKAFDAKQYGGAPMLGLNGLVVKTHGSAKAVEVKNSILQCVLFKTHNVDDKIKEVLNNKD